LAETTVTFVFGACGRLDCFGLHSRPKLMVWRNF